MNISPSDSIIPVIMAGGSGTRLWPMSRESRPKQFLAWDNGPSLLQRTVERARSISAHTPLVICQNRHRFMAAEQLREQDALGGLILEPVGRNTAPTVAVATQILLQGAWPTNDPQDPLLLVLPADHVIADVEDFVAAMTVAVPLAHAGALVTFGVQPARAETGYGYIEAGDEHDGGYQVKRFVEKPDSATAERFLRDGGFYWNSGMFLFRASRYWQELIKFQPEMAEVCAEAVLGIEEDLDFYRLPSAIFSRCPADSIDYAVMERTDAAVVVPLQAQWSDVGNWQAWWEVAEKTAENNVVVGDVMLTDGARNLVRAESRLVAVIGVSDMVVIETKDAVLVASRLALDGVKALV
ncbi:MAG: mannose-1-phosphate guanylyltransferase/mannose-6-phosphate isomerase, partial [Porticoccaceae bacterium]